MATEQDTYAILAPCEVDRGPDGPVIPCNVSPRLVLFDRATDYSLGLKKATASEIKSLPRNSWNELFYSNLKTLVIDLSYLNKISSKVTMSIIGSSSYMLEKLVIIISENNSNNHFKPIMPLLKSSKTILIHSQYIENVPRAFYRTDVAKKCSFLRVKIKTSEDYRNLQQLLNLSELRFLDLTFDEDIDVNGMDSLTLKSSIKSLVIELKHPGLTALLSPDSWSGKRNHVSILGYLSVDFCNNFLSCLEIEYLESLVLIRRSRDYNNNKHIPLENPNPSDGVKSRLKVLVLQGLKGCDQHLIDRLIASCHNLKVIVKSITSDKEVLTVISNNLNIDTFGVIAQDLSLFSNNSEVLKKVDSNLYEISPEFRKYLTW